MSKSIIKYYGSQNRTQCGYCRQSNSSNSHGMTAYVMTVEDYQDLVDRGWRRCGTYYYKPRNKNTCCVCYTIKCDTLEFKLTKSQKKVLKRMRKFLLDGVKDKILQCDYEDVPEEDSRLCLPNIPDVCKATAKTISDAVNKELSADNKQKENVETVPEQNQNAPDRGETISSSSFLKGKRELPITTSNKSAKQKRYERKVAKLASKGLSPDEIKQSFSKKANESKTLNDFIYNLPAESRHTLKVTLVPANKELIGCELELYRKYQVAIHNDPPEKITEKSFARFLAHSPLQLKLVEVNSEEFLRTHEHSFSLYSKYQKSIHNDPPENYSEYLDFLGNSPLQLSKLPSSPDHGYGSFHQQYWLDDKLIAVGVIDILPKCISSVYFFYDPEYRFLSLGTYASLREIHFTTELAKKCSNLRYYYLGYYIHTCPKMAYKGHLNSSYLLCPEIYTWHLLTNELREELNRTKYLRLNTDPTAVDENEFTEEDLNSVLLYIGDRNLITYENFLLIHNKRFPVEELMEYCKLVGRKCAHNIVFSLI